MVQPEVTTVDQLKQYIGQEIGVGQWVLVTQEMVNQFADATGDYQFIHVDPDRARQTMFGGTVAHGFFTLSMLAGFLNQDREGLHINLGGRVNVNYGLNKVRFITPVPVGKRIRNHSRLVGVEQDSNRSYVQVIAEQSVEIEGVERPAMVAETITRTYF